VDWLKNLVLSRAVRNEQLSIFIAIANGHALPLAPHNYGEILRREGWLRPSTSK
jgi:hypothetical protein